MRLLRPSIAQGEAIAAVLKAQSLGGLTLGANEAIHI